jgi:hypothetical protein
VSVEHIRCGSPANRSEELAADRCVAALGALGDGTRWVVLSNLASSSSALHQSDELDLVCIGPRGVLLIEDKHWDAAWMRDHRETVEAEAEKLTAKAKRLAGRVRALLPAAAPKVEQWLLLTRDVGGTKLDSVRGVPVRTLKTLEEAFRSQPANVLSPVQVDTLAQGLEPRAKIQLDGRIRRIAEYHNLELCSRQDDRFHRVYRGVHQRTKEKAVLHLYDLSATDEKEARRLAEREFRSMQLLQKCRWVPRFRDSFQDLPDYPGELCFFTLFDPEAPSLKRRAADATWGDEERVEFAARVLEALRELHGLTDDNAVAIVHRSLSPDSVLVAARDQPLFIRFHLARLPATQTVGTAVALAPSGPSVAPEVTTGGLSAATQASDVFALCATLATLFEGRSASLAGDARNVLAAGLAAAPDQRALLHELARQLRDLLPKPEAQPAPPGFPMLPARPACPPVDYWCEGVEVPLRDMTLRVVTHLQSGTCGHGVRRKLRHHPALGSHGACSAGATPPVQRPEQHLRRRFPPAIPQAARRHDGFRLSCRHPHAPRPDPPHVCRAVIGGMQSDKGLS